MQSRRFENKANGDTSINKLNKVRNKRKQASDYRKSETFKVFITVFLIVSIIIVGVNMGFAQCELETTADTSLSEKVITVSTAKQLTIEEETFNADIEIPLIAGLDNKELENSLNEKYLVEGTNIYEDFKAEIEEIKEQGLEAHLGVSSGYIIKTDTDKILSIERYVVNVAASSSTVTKYDNIDKENEILLTLQCLFKNDDYIDAISRNIKEQMLEQVKEDEGKHYWVEGVEESDFFELFEKIAPEQKFYINENYKLVIVFDKYEVAPGYMGVVEFEIPTNIISSLLVSDEYIR